MSAGAPRTLILLAAMVAIVTAVACSRAHSGDNETGDGIPAVPAGATPPAH